MGEITEALRRAKLAEDKQDVFRDAEPKGDGTPSRARDWGGPPIDSADEDSLGSFDPLDHPRTAPDADPSTQQIEIPRSMTGFWIPRAVLVEPPLPGSESFRHFAVKVNRELDLRKQNALLVTSALPEEGKTTVSCNLALAIASISGGRKTALVDLDLHRSSVSRVMGVVPRVGFENVLSGDVPLQAARVATNLPGFDLYPIATPLHHTTKKAYELLAGVHFQTALRLLMRNYDRVVFDAPPALLVPDVALVADHIPACIVVTRRGVTKRSSYLELLSIIPEEKFLGTFFNEDSRSARPHYAYYLENTGATE